MRDRWVTQVSDLWASSGLGRPLAVTVAFLGFGLVAGMSGLTLILADTDSDPRGAFAFAPLPAATTETAAPKLTPEPRPEAAPEPPRAETALAREIKSPADAAPAPTVAAQVPSADTPAPAAAAAPVSEPALPAASAPAAAQDAPMRGNAAPARVEAAPPPLPAAKPQKTARHQTAHRHGAQVSASADTHARRSRYAQHFWPFW